MISRSALEKRSFDISIIRRDSHNFINDTEIPMQALGLRGTFPLGISYDAFISRAVCKPDGYHTRKWVPGFMVSCRF